MVKKNLLVFMSIVFCSWLAWGSEVDFGKLIPIESSIEGAISNRHQEHMWMTSDGGIHLLVAGNSISPKGLRMFSSYDKGENWINTLEIKDTENRVKPDGLLQNSMLQLVYLNKDRELIQAAFQYIDKKWVQRDTIRLIDKEEQFVAERPTLALDSQNRLWLAVAAEYKDGSKTSIRIGYVNDRSQLNFVSEVFGADNASKFSSAKILNLNDGIVVVYTDFDGFNYSLNLAHFFSTDDLVKSFTIRQDEKIIIYDPEIDRDRYGTHFNAVAGDDGYIHIVTTTRHQLYYFKWNAESGLIKIDLGESTPYVQVAHGEQCVYVAAHYTEAPYGRITRLMVSEDNGENFRVERRFAGIPEGNFGGKALLEMPAYLPPTSCTNSFVPLVRQVLLPTGLYGFLFFN